MTSVPVPGLRVGPLLQKEEFDEEINCGLLQTCEYKCVVLPDPVEEMTSGGIYKPKETVEKEGYRTSKCTFIMGSDSAFRDWGGYIPKPGDRVLAGVYSGALHKGPDGRTYRIVNDKDILGQLDE